MLCGDGQGRAKSVGGKHPNAKTKHPCLYCMAEQKEDATGGDLGDPQFDFESHRRTHGQTLKDFAELDSLAGAPAVQTTKSRDMGLNPNPDWTGLLLPLFASMLINVLEHVPVERLHIDALVRSKEMRCERIFDSLLASAYSRVFVISLFPDFARAPAKPGNSPYRIIAVVIEKAPLHERPPFPSAWLIFSKAHDARHVAR